MSRDSSSSPPDRPIADGEPWAHLSGAVSLGTLLRGLRLDRLER
jgi:hypothetical protein